MTLAGSPSCTMMRWYGLRYGRHCSRKSRLRMVGITMSNSSFSNGVGVAILSGSDLSQNQPKQKTASESVATLSQLRSPTRLCWSIYTKERASPPLLKVAAALLHTDRNPLTRAITNLLSFVPLQNPQTKTLHRNNKTDRSREKDIVKYIHHSSSSSESSNKPKGKKKWMVHKATYPASREQKNAKMSKK